MSSNQKPTSTVYGKPEPSIKRCFQCIEEGFIPRFDERKKVKKGHGQRRCSKCENKK